MEVHIVVDIIIMVILGITQQVMRLLLWRGFRALYQLV